MILQSLRSLLDMTQQAGAIAPQIGIVPGADGSLAVIIAWQQGQHTHEVATHYTADEVQSANDAQLLASLTVLTQEATDQAARHARQSLTSEQVASRIVQAARSSAAHATADALGKIIPAA